MSKTEQQKRSQVRILMMKQLAKKKSEEKAAMKQASIDNPKVPKKIEKK